MWTHECVLLVPGYLCEARGCVHNFNSTNETTHLSYSETDNDVDVNVIPAFEL